MNNMILQGLLLLNHVVPDAAHVYAVHDVQVETVLNKLELKLYIRIE
jgi:hypothetical protein